MKPPLGVKLIAILCFIFSIMGIATVISGTFFISRNINEIKNNFQHNTKGFIKNILIDLYQIAMIIIYFLVGKNLWSGKKWARILAIILGFYGIADSIYVLIVAPYVAFFANIKAIICILIILYLLLNKNAIKYFQNSDLSNLDSEKIS